MSVALPYYKWFWQDWRANRAVQRMTYIQRGIYRELLDECWAEGFIPDDIEKLADICGCPPEVMADAWQVLSKCFEPAGDGVLINEKLHTLRTDKDAERARKAANGSAGGKAKSLKSKDNEASAKQVLASAKQLPYIREDKIREDKTKDLGGEPQTKRARQLPPDFTPDDTHRAKAQELGVNLVTEFEAFKDYNRARGTTFKDWSAGLMTWIRNAAKFNGSRAATARPPRRGAIHSGIADQDWLKTAAINNWPEGI